MGSIRESIRETISNSNEGSKKQISLMIDEQLLHMTDRVGEKMKALTNNKVGSRNQLIELALAEYVKEVATVLQDDFSVYLNEESVSSVDEMKNEETVIKNVLIVPANEEGFESVFMAKHQWYSIQIAQYRIPEIEYIAAYRNAPHSCITHYAKVKEIEPYNDGKLIINFEGPPVQLPNAITLGDRKGIRRGMYTSLEKLMKAETLIDLK